MAGREAARRYPQPELEAHPGYYAVPADLESFPYLKYQDLFTPTHKGVQVSIWLHELYKQTKQDKSHLINPFTKTTSLEELRIKLEAKPSLAKTLFFHVAKTAKELLVGEPSIEDKSLHRPELEKALLVYLLSTSKPALLTAAQLKHLLNRASVLQEQFVTSTPERAGGLQPQAELSTVKRPERPVTPPVEGTFIDNSETDTLPAAGRKGKHEGVPPGAGPSTDPLNLEQQPTGPEPKDPEKLLRQVEKLTGDIGTFPAVNEPPPGAPEGNPPGAPEGDAVPSPGSDFLEEEYVPTCPKMANPVFCDKDYPPAMAKVDLESQHQGFKGLVIDTAEVYSDAMAADGKMAHQWTQTKLMVPNENEAAAKILAKAIRHQLGAVIECSNLLVDAINGLGTPPNKAAIEEDHTKPQNKLRRKELFLYYTQEKIALAQARQTMTQLENLLKETSGVPFGIWADNVMGPAGRKFLTNERTLKGLGMTEVEGNEQNASFNASNSSFFGHSQTKTKFSIGKKELPKVELKTFDGSIANYIHWKKDFMSYVGELYKNGEIDAYQSYGYLISVMPADIKTEMKAMPYESQSWDYWMKELELRFGAKLHQRLIWLQKVKELDALDKGNFTLWRTQFQQHIRALEDCGSDIAALGEEIMTIILPKLHPVVSTAYTTHCVTKNMVLLATNTTTSVTAVDRYSIKEFSQWLDDYDQELRAASRRAAYANPGSSGQRNANGKRHYTANTHFTEEEQDTHYTAGAGGGPKRPKGKGQGGQRGHGGQGNPAPYDPNQYKSIKCKTCFWCYRQPNQADSQHESKDCNEARRHAGDVPCARLASGNCWHCKNMYNSLFEGHKITGLPELNPQNQVVCFRCLKLGHKGIHCKVTNPEVCKYKDKNGEQCTKTHHPFLHKSASRPPARKRRE